MADNHTDNSEQVRERATEDLFSIDAAPKHLEKDELEELGSGLEGRISEELFLQSILEGSGDGNLSSSADAVNVAVPQTEKRIDQAEERAPIGSVTDTFLASEERGGGAAEQSDMDMASSTPTETTIVSEPALGNYRERGLSQAGQMQQGLPVEAKEASAPQAFVDSQPVSAAAAASVVPLPEEPLSGGETNQSPSDIRLSATGVAEGAEGGTLDTDFSGSDTITVTSTGNDGAQVVKTVSETVSDVNDTPTLEVVSTATVDEDGSKTIIFSASDLNGTVSTAATADNGTVTVNENTGEITYTPKANFNGSDTLTVTTTDNDGASVVKTVSVTVSDVNDAPTLDVVSTVTVDEDGSKTISFSAGDLDGTVSTAASADHGTVTVNEESGEVTYQPDTDYFGGDTITLTTTDDDGAVAVKTVAVTVNGIDDSAEAPTLSASVGESEIVRSIVMESLSIDNPSFEIASLADGGWNLSTPGWQQQQGNSGTFNPADVHLQGGASDGENSAFLVQNASISQEIDAKLESGKSYSLQVDVGDRGDMDSPPDYQINLYAGEQLIGSVTEADFPTTDDAFITATLTVDGDSLPDDFSGFGENLRIELVNDSSLQTNFDDVRLTTSEPGTPETIRYPLNIDAGLTDTDGSESLSIQVGGLPEGALLSAGTINGDGTWSLDPGETDGLTISVPVATADFNLDISATSTESLGGDSTRVSVPLSVEIPILDTSAEAPELSVTVGDPEVNYDLIEESITVDNFSFEDNSLVDGSWGRSIQGWEQQGVNGAFDPSSSSFGEGASNGENTGFINRNSSISQQVDATFESGKSYTLQVDVGDRGDIANVPDYEIRLYAGDQLLGSVSQAEFPTSDDEFVTATLSIDTDVLADDFSGFGENLRIELFNGSSIQTNFDNVRLSEGTQGEPQSLSYTIDIDAALTDTDGSESLSITVEGVPEGAVLSAGTDNGDGSWSLSPDETEGLNVTVPLNAEDFTLNIKATATEALGHLGEGEDGTAVETVAISVAEFNNTPTLDLAEALSVDEDSSITIGFTADDTGGTVSAVASADNGRVTVDERSGEITYMPDADFNGSDTITLTTTNNDGASVVKTVNVTVNDVNDAPTASDDVGFSPRNATLAGEMTFDDGVPSARTGSVAVTNSGQVDDAAVMSSANVEMSGLDLSSQSGAQTTVSMWVKADPSGSWEMIAASDRYDLAFNNGNLGFNTARGDHYGTDASEFNDGEWHQVVATFTNGDVTQNSIYIDGVQQDLSQIQGSPSSASANIASDGGTLHFGGWGANSNYRFTGSMDEVKVFNGALDGDEVADLYAIESQNDSWNHGLVEGEENRVLEIDPSTLLANDTDVEGDSLTITSVESATHGTVEMIDGKIIFTPEEDYEGTASFEYTVSDGEGGADTASVEISLAANTDPVLVSDGTLVLQNATLAGEITFDEGLPSSTSGSVSVESDGQVDSAADLSSASIRMSGTDVSGDTGAQTTISMWVKADPAGSWEMIAASNYYDLAFNNGNIGFNTAGGDHYGADASEFDDGEWHQVVATFTNGDVTQNSIYIDGVQQDLSQIQGSPSSTNANIASDGGTLHFGGWGGNNSYRFTGSMDEIKVYHGDLSAAEVGRLYEIESQGQTWNEATDLATDEDSAITIDVLANDTDVDGDSLTIAEVGAVTDSDGNVVGETEIIDNKILFTPNDQLDALTQGEQKTISFTYTANDGRGGSDSTTVSFNVNGTNDGPVDISFTGNTVTENAAGGTVVATLSASDVDAEETFSYAVTDDPSGLFEVVGDQLQVKQGADIDFESAENHQVRIQVTDGSGDVYSESVTINVADVNEVPPGINLTGTSGSDHLVGTDGDDSFEGSRGDDTLEGGAGDDTFKVYGDAGTDQYDGGAGQDRIQGSRYGDVIRVNDNLDNIQNIEAIDGGEGYDILQAGSGDDRIDLSNGPALSSIEEIDGGSGNDHITGTSGDDHIEGNRGDDTLEGGAGNDTFKVYGDAGTDQYDGGAGQDRIEGSRYNDVIRVNDNLDNIQNIEAIDGGEGYDILQAGSGDDRIDLSNGPALSSIEEIDGGSGNDHITGTSGDDYIEGNRGDDTLEGGAGDDNVSGGSGSDTYIFNPFEGNDNFDGGNGGGWTDTIQLDANADPGADPENPWTIEIDGEQVQYDLAAQALELNPDTSGVITLSDGSELTFDGIEKIEW